MNLAGFCRNCLSNWLKDAADAQGVALSKDESREAVYGMPYETWKAKHQGTATPEQLEAMKKVHPGTERLGVRLQSAQAWVARSTTAFLGLAAGRCGRAVDECDAALNVGPANPKGQASTRGGGCRRHLGLPVPLGVQDGHLRRR